MVDLTRRHAAGGAALSLGLCHGAGSTARAAGQDSDAVRGDRLERGRLTIPVRIDGQGPFHFAVDSAANASVIASDLALSLALPDAGPMAMHTLVAREITQTVRAGRLETGALRREGVRLALASRLGLDGTDGLIGTDLLAGLRLDLRFRGAQRARVTGSRRSSGGFFDSGRQSTRLVHAAQQRFGELLMIDIRAGGVDAYAIIDTGAQVTIINPSLAAAARVLTTTLRDGTRRVRIQSPTGRSAPAEAVVLNSLRFAGVSLGSRPVLTGEFHTFDVWGLANHPAMLMGVDVLGLFESVAIDLKRGEIVFEI